MSTDRLKTEGGYLVPQRYADVIDAYLRYGTHRLDTLAEEVIACWSPSHLFCMWLRSLVWRVEGLVRGDANGQG